VTHLALRFDRGHHGVHRAVKCGQHAVARASEWVTGMATDRPMKDLIMQIHRTHHIVRKAAKKNRAADYIGSENGSFAAL
jgi:hypothetical protein